MPYLLPALEEANMLLEVIACQEGMVKIKEFHEILEDNENFLNHDKGMDAGKIEHIVFEMLSAVHARGPCCAGGLYEYSWRDYSYPWDV